MMSTHTAAYLDEKEEVGDGPWFCLTCKPFYCKDCKRQQQYLHVLLPRCEPPPIVIFDTKDDDTLLDSALIWQKQGRNPRIIKYHPNLGLSITIYDVRQIVGKT